MPFSTMLVELLEKMGLLAAAALLAVLVPPLRARVLGTPERKSAWAPALFGVALSIWGAMLGFELAGEHFNVRAIGVLIAGFLGGWRAGVLAGLGGGLFYAARVDPETAPWVLVASISDGLLAGLVAERRPEWAREPVRAFAVAIVVQAVHIALVGACLLAAGHAGRYLPAWHAHLAKLVANAAGVALFVAVARIAIGREEAAVDLARAHAAAERSALEALRRRLEPHFLFNALNAVRATIRKDPDRARSLVSDLADLYRYLLSHPDAAPLGAEIDHARSYLAIERARLGDERLSVEVDVPDALRAMPVPALLLQPLVENAVKHGVARRSGAGQVRITARALDPASAGVLEVVVEDQSAGDPVPALAGEEGAGIALGTLRERLVRRLGPDARLDLELTERGARAVLHLPALVEYPEPRPASEARRAA